ncbi:patatin-like phospholipase RssA [Ferrimonas sp. SCSIO 43195]|uniref:patatin-like phospholipase RssA n=1 Tax=Ferrimonas sp. SCSIO 43195 TaxID=2822844 RepID=UPI0020761C52|nr:patatin-like phospholipase RssA [Ferrimonas sp. SCSIO 43195]USD36697.1 patatin-like phospholipase RssA [Ferrimonas sp. SCSIO 43195]
MADVKIGVALGSGAAKGWAHIGVLRGLNRIGIIPTHVAGCSIGAFVGAAYAAGKLDELEQWVRGFSSWDVVGLLDLSWRRGGLVSGDKIFKAASDALGIIDIDQLNKPYVAVATDLYTGQEVWLDSGSLSDIVRASCSIPGLMEPKQIGERWLVDGAVVNPVPVSACRAMGADLVIAVDLHGDARQSVAEPVRLTKVSSQVQPQPEESGTGFMDLLASGKELVNEFADRFSNAATAQPNMLAVMHQSMEILEQRHKRARLMGDPPEALVMPRVGDINTMEFQRAGEAIAAGEEAVLRIQHQIEAEVQRFG